MHKYAQGYKRWKKRDFIDWTGVIEPGRVDVWEPHYYLAGSIILFVLVLAVFH